MRKKKESLLTRRELSTELGIHMMTITKWERDGLPIAERGRRGKPSLYSVSAVRQWLAEREEAAKENGTYDLARERARKEKAQAILAEQTVAIRAGDLLLKTEVEAIWCAEFAAIRARLLSWPTILSDRLIRALDIGGPSAHEAKLKDEVYAILTELSQPRPEGFGEVRPAKKKAVKKKTKRKAVKK